jgi:non-canonical purine NTP pyrophosphatase (RdgB/HAM1 family)
MELLVATNNSGKIREIQKSLQGVPLRLRYLGEFGDVSTPEEIGTTYEENAVLKAISYAKQTAVCALADDSGLEVDALGGEPGVLSARYGAGCDQDRTEKLLTALTQRPAQKRTARFVCCMALAGWPVGSSQATGEQPHVIHVCQAKCEGLIGYEPRGKNGFGYDPVFVPIGYDETFGELPAAVKNVISHRAQALAAMRDFLNGWIAST